MSKQINLINSIFISIIFVIAIFIVSVSWVNKNYYSWSDDSLRHLKYSQLYDKYSSEEINQKYSLWKTIKNSILTDYDTDLWEWHHKLLHILSKSWITDISLLKLYYSIILWLFIFIIVYFSLKNKLWYSLTFILLFWFLANSEFLFRILLARPFWFTIILFLLLVLSLIYKRYYYLIFLFIISTYYHMLFYILFIPILLYSIIIFKKDKKIFYKILSYTFLWTLIWILLHHNSIDYLILSSITFFYVPILHKINTAFAWELGWTLRWAQLYTLWIYVFLLIYYKLIQYTKNKKNIFKLNTNILFISLLILFLFICSLIITRFFEFYYPVIFLWIILIVSKIIKIDPLFSKKINLLNKTKYTIIIFLIVLIFPLLKINSILNQSWLSVLKNIEFVEEIKKIIPEQSNVMSYQLLSFPILYYWLWEKYKYTSVMEPYFLYLKDKDKFNNYKDFFISHYNEPKNNINQETPFLILKDYWVDYLILITDYKNMNYKSKYILEDKIEELNNNNKFKLIYNKWDNYLWKIMY